MQQLVSDELTLSETQAMMSGTSEDLAREQAEVWERRYVALFGEHQKTLGDLRHSAGLVELMNGFRERELKNAEFWFRAWVGTVALFALSIYLLWPKSK